MSKKKNPVMFLNLNEARSRMAVALQTKLSNMRDGSSLTLESAAEVHELEAGRANRVRLELDVDGYMGIDSKRAVTILLVEDCPDSKGDMGDGMAAYAWRVRLECSALSSSPEGTVHTVKGWQKAIRLVQAALEAIDEMPPIADRADEHTDIPAWDDCPN